MKEEKGYFIPSPDIHTLIHCHPQSLAAQSIFERINFWSSKGYESSTCNPLNPSLLLCLTDNCFLLALSTAFQDLPTIDQSCYKTHQQTIMRRDRFPRLEVIQEANFEGQCHFTIERYSCGHQKWSNTPVSFTSRHVLLSTYTRIANGSRIWREPQKLWEFGTFAPIARLPHMNRSPREMEIR